MGQDGGHRERTERTTKITSAFCFELRKTENQKRKICNVKVFPNKDESLVLNSDSDSSGVTEPGQVDRGRRFQTGRSGWLLKVFVVRTGD